MGGRFGKYGDLKRRKALQRSRIEKFKMKRADLATMRSRSGSYPHGNKRGDIRKYINNLGVKVKRSKAQEFNTH